MDITVIGSTGYVGLVTATSMADDGHNVIGVDVNKEAVQGLLEGKMPFFEGGMEGLVNRNITSGRLNFTTSLEGALGQANLAFIAVGTYPRPDGFYDMGSVYEVAEEIGRLVDNELYVVMKSTVNVGEHRTVRQKIEEQMRSRGLEHKIHYISNPEFLAQGSAVSDAQSPDRVVVGVEDEESLELMKELYASKIQNGAPFIEMQPIEAETVKLAANSFLATKISFFNEVAMLCDKIGANIYNVREGVIGDHRINPSMTHPGPGYAGSCFPKDTEAFAKQSRKLGSPVSLVEQTITVNNQMRGYMAQRVMDFYDGDVSGKKFALLGLSFKPRTDDVRDTAASNVVEELVSEGASIVAFDPHAMEAAKQKDWGKKIEYAQGSWEAIDGADGLIIMTDSNEYKQLDLCRLKGLLSEPVVFDARNLFGRPQATKIQHLRDLGFVYRGIGTEVKQDE